MLPVPLLQVPGGPELVIVLFLLIALGAFVAWVAISYWVYRDARKRNNDSPALWAALVFFLGVPGVIVWFLVREDV